MTLLALHFSHNNAVVYLRADAIVALNTTYEGSKLKKSSGCKVSLGADLHYMVKETAEEILATLQQTNYGVFIARINGCSHKADNLGK
jgi:dihydroorotate dehydrogenase